MRKRIILFIALAICITSTTTCLAASSSVKEDNFEVGVKYAYIQNVTVGLNISSNGIASMLSSIDAQSTVDSVTISSYLQKYDNGWKTVQHWTEKTNSNSAYLSKNYAVASGHYYRVQTYFYAYDGSQCESTSVTSPPKYY